MSARLYSVIRSSKPAPGIYRNDTVARGLPLEEARAMAARLDREYQERVEAAGRHYSSWTADLHNLQLET